MTDFRLVRTNQAKVAAPRPANWSFRTEAPADWQYVAEICAERGEFDFAAIHAEYLRLAALRSAA